MAIQFPMIDVVIIDNENAISRCLDSSIVNVTLYEDDVFALNAVTKSCPSVILVNININRLAINTFVVQLYKSCPQSVIALIGPDLSDEDLLDCLASGCKGYLRFNDVKANIDKAVKVLAAGEAWVSRRIVAKLLDRIQQQATG